MNIIGPSNALSSSIENLQQLDITADDLRSGYLGRDLLYHKVDDSTHHLISRIFWRILSHFQCFRTFFYGENFDDIKKTLSNLSQQVQQLRELHIYNSSVEKYNRLVSTMYRIDLTVTQQREKEKCQESEASTVKIQSLFRGYTARKDFEKKKKEDSVIKSLFKKFGSRIQSAATCIQKKFRDRNARKLLKNLDWCMATAVADSAALQLSNSKTPSTRAQNTFRQKAIQKPLEKQNVTIDTFHALSLKKHSIAQVE